MTSSSFAAERVDPSERLFWSATDNCAPCPVCASAVAKDGLADWVLQAPRAALAGGSSPLAYLRCGACGMVYAPNGESLRYEDDNGSEEALRHYLEEGAGIDLLIGPLCRLDRSGSQRYAEIGCAFGFSLDFAELCLGWDVRGIDPSPLGAAGREILGLPIEQRYFSEARPLPPPKSDVLQVSEVIEHVTDSHSFMRGLVGGLDADGVVIISTPNAAALRPGMPDDLLLQVLQPGVHLRLFSARSLVMLAEAHGLMHHHIHETVDDLTLYAAPRRFALRDAAAADRGIYLDYLRRRLAKTMRAGALRRGLQSRLLRELTLQGRFTEVDVLLPQIFADYQECGIDLTDPAGLEPRRQAPYNVATVLYCLGMAALIGRADRAGALRFFDGCVRWHTGVAPLLAIGGVNDASAATLARLAAVQAVSIGIEVDPKGVHDRCIHDPDGNPLSAFDQQRLFGALVNQGDHARAAMHYDHVVVSILQCNQQPPGSVGHHIMTCFTLGIFALNHLDDRTRARDWLTLAADLADGSTEHDAMRCAAVLALHRAADPIVPDNEPAVAECAEHDLKPNLVRRVFARAARQARWRSAIAFADLSETPDETLLPPLDRSDVNETMLTPEQREWRRDGMLMLRKFLPSAVTDRYIARRATLDGPDGWLSPAPYLHVPELRALALYPPLLRMLEHLISEPMLLHLASSGWTSIKQSWHQDDYLNPPFVNNWYCGVWIALAQIDPAAGPFEYVPGSHRWPPLRGEKVRRFLSKKERTRQEGGANHWPKYSERFVVPAIEAEVARRGIAPKTFLAEKGDVLIWHSRLIHRDSVATAPSQQRQSLITHYSGINHRPDMPERAIDENGQSYALFDIPLR